MTVTKPVQTSQAADPVAVTTRTTYDTEGRVATVTMADGGPEAIAFTFAYDAQGNRQSVTYPSGIVKRWDRTYDAQDNLTELVESQPGPVAGPPAWKTTAYDPETGRQTTLTDAVGNSIAYTYDGFRLEGETYTPTGGEGASHNVRFTEVNDLIRTVETWAGDAQSTLLRSETQTRDPETGALASVSKPEGTIEYGYDNGGTLASMSYLGRTLLYRHDFFGRLKSAEAPEGDWEYRYNDVGQKVRVTNRKNDTHEDRTYDALGRLLGVSHVNDATGAVVFRIDYTLGQDGNRLGALETRGANVTRWEYEHDALGRLTREKRDVGGDGSFERDVSYTYDADSNRDEETDNLPGGETRKYVYESNSQRLDKITVEGATVEDYTWTANGEIASKSDSSGVTTYLWGPDGTLAEVQFPGGESIEYSYDHTGELVARKFLDDQGQTLSHSRYLVDHQNLTGYSQRIAEIDGTDGTVRWLNTFADRLQAQTRAESGGLTKQTLHTDGLGSIRHLTGEDASGSTLDEAFDFEAFGSLITGDRSLTDYAYTGQVADSSSGLQFHRARWLSPSEGAWLSQDPLLDLSGNRGNAYTYAGHGPLLMVDILGTFTLLESLTVVAIIQEIVQLQVISLHRHLLESDADFISGSDATQFLGVLALVFIIFEIVGLAFFAASLISRFVMSILRFGADFIGGIYRLMKRKGSLRSHRWHLDIGGQGKLPGHLDVGGEGKYPDALNVNQNEFGTVGNAAGVGTAGNVNVGDPIPALIHIDVATDIIPMADDSVELVTIENMWPRNKDGVKHMFEQIKRVLAPGGRVRLLHPADAAADLAEKAVRRLRGRIVGQERPIINGIEYLETTIEVVL